MSSHMRFPPWVILHIPHDSVHIPANVRRLFKLTDAELDREILKMTDFWTYALYANGVPLSQTVIAPVNRMVTDVERFPEDKDEIMASRGMGAVYTVTSELKSLRDKPTETERTELMKLWYWPHHNRLTELVGRALEKYGRALVIDAHSFPSDLLPYEDSDKFIRPEICLGTDDFHTPKDFADEMYDAFDCAGFDTGFNAPFAGALTPLKYYGKDKRVMSLMVEVRRDLYEDETTGEMNIDFVRFSKTLKKTISSVLNGF